MQLTPSSKIFSGLPVRHLLIQLQFQPTEVDDQITMGLIFGTTDETRLARTKSYLTNATEQEHQIRFPLADRVRRSLRRLAHSAQSLLPDGPYRVQVLADDFVSLDFFRVLPQFKVQIIDQGTASNQHLSTFELELSDRLLQPAENLDAIVEFSRERVYAGDYRAAYQVLSHVPKSQRDQRTNYILGLCCNFFGRTEEAETYFRQMLGSENPLDRVKAAYVTAMLYLRMHEKSRQSLEEAETLLEQAFADMEANPDIADANFHRVFNRNGYALCLYRRGKVKEALALLDWGLSHLKDGAGSQRLHRSVLIYNAIQCLRDLGRYTECEERCAELLEIDPLFPEYHMERARALLMQNRINDALASLSRALELDGEIPELFALIGYAYVQKRNFKMAERFYECAIKLDPNNDEYKLDRDFCLMEDAEAPCYVC